MRIIYPSIQILSRNSLVESVLPTYTPTSGCPVSRALEVILATYPSELYLDQVSILLNCAEQETVAFLESGLLRGRQLDGNWFVLKEHVESFIMTCKSPAVVGRRRLIIREMGFTSI
jgi:hypothetical protein